MNRQMRLWMDALRSGKYEQGKGALRRDGKFCCLGVLCDVYRKETGDGMWVDGYGNGNSFNTGYFNTGYGGHFVAFPPLEVYNWLGIDYIDIGNIQDPLRRSIDPIEANDTFGWTFDQIADALERRYAGT